MIINPHGEYGVALKLGKQMLSSSLADTRALAAKALAELRKAKDNFDGTDKDATTFGGLPQLLINDEAFMLASRRGFAAAESVLMVILRDIDEQLQRLPTPIWNQVDSTNTKRESRL